MAVVYAVGNCVENNLSVAMENTFYTVLWTLIRVCGRHVCCGVSNGIYQSCQWSHAKSWAEWAYICPVYGCMYRSMNTLSNNTSCFTIFFTRIWNIMALLKCLYNTHIYSEKPHVFLNDYRTTNYKTFKKYLDNLKDIVAELETHSSASTLCH